jgi:hypothetical protein
MRGTVPNPTRPRGLRAVSLNVTDRALRYRANRNAPPGPRRCHYCGTRRNVEIEHVDGFEENGAPENLTWSCRRCNTKKGAVFARAGRGRRTRQFNPGGGARNVAQWVNAVMALKGEGGTMSLSDAIAMVHATPHSKRSEFAREIWERRRRSGKESEVPF